MGKIVLEVDDTIVKKLGEQKVKEYLAEMLDLVFLEEFIKKAKDEISKIDINYAAEMDKIREETWKEYKKDLNL